MIRLENLSLGYGRRLIEGADAEIRRGALTALLGRNGTGKSTLLRAISGVQPVMSGRITIDGRDVKEYTAGEYSVTK